MKTMRTKRPLLALLVLILGTTTVGATYLLFTSNRPNASTSSLDCTVSVSPTNTTLYADIGTIFTVNINITNAIDLYVWQAGVRFNATILEALSLEEGHFLKQKGTTLWTNGTIDNNNGIIHYHACALAGNVTGASGNGTLTTITFRVRNYGDSYLQLTNVILLNSNLTDMDKTLVNGTVQVKIPGDVNGDRKVDAFDLSSLGRAYGSDPSKPNWNPQCDFNGDNKVDASDLVDLSNNYGITV